MMVCRKVHVSYEASQAKKKERKKKNTGQPFAYHLENEKHATLTRKRNPRGMGWIITIQS